MNFYQSIRKYYDNIFPLNQKQVEFTKSFFEDKNSRLIEIGCANGKLTNALSEYNITGIDLEEEFINDALTNYPNVDFQALNMLNLNEITDEFDGIICFGNTLVHLEVAEIEEFIEKAYKQLKTDGTLLIQILNYDYVVNEQLESLPLIDNDVITFVREYQYQERIKFKTTLTVKNSNSVINNVIDLSPVRKADLEKILKTKGFTEIEFYSSFDKTPYQYEKLPLIISAKK